MRHYLEPLTIQIKHVTQSPLLYTHIKQNYNNQTASTSMIVLNLKRHDILFTMNI